MEFRIVICGSRIFSNYGLLLFVMRDVIRLVCAENPQVEIIIVSGGARGADKLGERFAAEYGFPVEKYVADWERIGRGAGPARNAQMAKIANLVVAFPVGKSRGTRNMIKQAEKRNVECIVISS